MSNPIEEYLVAPSSDSIDVCPVCRSWRAPAQPRCDNCEHNLAVLGQLTLVIPITLYRKPSMMRDWLSYYKQNREQYHPEFGLILGDILNRWIESCGAGLTKLLSESDVVSVVPSAVRIPPHPLSAVIDQYVPTLASKRLDVLTRGAGDLSHRNPTRNGYVADPRVSGKTVLLVDDVYTTGSRSQSAAFALVSAGSKVPAILTIGRRINPEWKPEMNALWERQAKLRFNFGGKGAG